jgi:hypothetical protein
LNLCNSLTHEGQTEAREIAMPVALKRQFLAATREKKTPVWVHLLLFGMAGLLVSALLMTYGIDLSPGFY